MYIFCRTTRAYADSVSAYSIAPSGCCSITSLSNKIKRCGADRDTNSPRCLYVFLIFLFMSRSALVLRNMTRVVIGICPSSVRQWAPVRPLGESLCRSYTSLHRLPCWRSDQLTFPEILQSLLHAWHGDRSRGSPLT